MIYHIQFITIIITSNRIVHSNVVDSKLRHS